MLTAADVPGELRIGLIHRDWPVFIPVGGRTSYTGDVLALVVAADRATARRAAELVAVDYRPLPPFADALAALDATEPAVWQVGDPAAPNVLSRTTYARSDHPDGLDVDAALAASAHTVHEVFQTQRIEHAFLEPESTLAVPHDDGTLEVFSGGQGVWDDRRQIADVLGIDRGPGARAPGRQRRRLRRQGGLRQPGPDRARRLAARPAGEVHVQPGGVAAGPPQAPPGAGRGVGRVRRRRAG